MRAGCIKIGGTFRKKMPSILFYVYVYSFSVRIRHCLHHRTDRVRDLSVTSDHHAHIGFGDMERERYGGAVFVLVDGDLVGMLDYRLGNY